MPNSHSWNTAESPFALLIGTNHVPTTDELNMLKALLAHPLLEVSRLDLEIERMRTVLGGLIAEKQKVQTYIDGHRALISPIRRIPPETLAEIFTHCLPVDRGYAVRDMSEAPLVLTTVCRDWRRIALNTPRLWRLLHLYLPSHLSDQGLARRIEGITLWLERSGSLPLSLSFHGSTDLDRFLFGQHSAGASDMRQRANENMKAMVHALMRFSERFKEISWSTSTVDWPTLVQLAPSLFPSLTRLRVLDLHPPRIWGLEEQQEMNVNWMEFTSVLARMPFLRELQIHSPHFVNDFVYPSLPCNWRQLTHVAIIHPLHISQVMEILVETPQIQSISFQVVFSPPALNPFPLVHLNDLRDMRLSMSLGRLGQRATIIHSRDTAPSDQAQGQEGLKSMLNNIQCPGLQSFSFTGGRLPGATFSEWPFAGLPLHNLETLELDMSMGSDGFTGLAECLASSHKLTTFQYRTLSSAGSLQDSHLLGLTPSPDHPVPWCPRLQHLRLLTTSSPPLGDGSQEPMLFTSFTSSILTAFLLQRRYEPTSLKSCDILFPHKFAFAEAELDTWRNLKKSGLKLRMHLPTARPNVPDLPDYGLPMNRHSRTRVRAPPDVELDDVPPDMKGPYGTIIIV